MTAIETPVEVGAATAKPAATAVHLIRLVRPRQWVKNLLTVPLALTTAPAWSPAAFARIGWATLAFTLASSIVYIGNDIADRGRDRLHPVKRSRPVASGRVSVPVATGCAVALAGLLAGLVTVAPAMSWWPLAGYLALNVAYSRWLKHLPLIDICAVSTGFVLRVIQGYDATGGRVSDLLLTAVFTGCLVLVVGKRREELDAAGDHHRPALAGYNLPLADQLLSLNIALTAGALLLFLKTDAPLGGLRQVALLVAVPLGLLSAFRYLQSVLVHHAGGDPIGALLRDRLLLGSATAIGLTVIAALVTARYPHLLPWTPR